MQMISALIEVMIHSDNDVEIVQSILHKLSEQHDVSMVTLPKFLTPS